MLAIVVETGGGMEPLSEVGLVEGWRTADTGDTAEAEAGMGVDGETWRASLAGRSGGGAGLAL